MAPPSDSASRVAALRNQKKGAPFKFLFPLVYAPVLPLIRLSLRHRPVLRDRLFTAVLAGAFVHGFYLLLGYPILRVMPLQSPMEIMDVPVTVMPFGVKVHKEHQQSKRCYGH